MLLQPPGSVAPGERSFSEFKLIKTNFPRGAMKQDSPGPEAIQSTELAQKFRRSVKKVRSRDATERRTKAPPQLRQVGRLS